MSTDDDLRWQPSLFAAGEVGFDRSFSAIRRLDLGEQAWIEQQSAWVDGADALFAELMELTPWRQRSMWMYEKRVAEPRLTHRWVVGEHPPPVPILVEMAEALSGRYGVTFTQIGTNLYRSGADSVAWHGDRVAREMESATVALISLGEPRPFRLRPKGGGAAISLLPDRGDLLVMGGSCQRTWDHAVPKVRSAGPRMSVQFRHAYDR